MKLKLKAMIAAACGATGILPAVAGMNITGATVLDSAADWSALGPVRLSPGASIDLAGNSLKCAGFAEYVELDHVDTDGNQWINTGYKTANASVNTPGGGDKVEIKFQMKDVETQQFLLCARSSNTSNFGCYMNKDGMLNFGYRTVSGAGSYATELKLDTDYTVTIDYNSKTFSVNGVTTDFSETASGQKALTGYAVSLFCSQNAGNDLDDTTSVAAMAKCRFYYMKIWDKDGNLKVDLVPALGVNENKVGLYDRVRNRFLTPLKNGGEATTFDGVSAHCELDYVDTDGAQYVNTGYAPSLTNAVEIKIQMLERTTREQILFCSRTASGMPFETSYTKDGNFKCVFANGKTTSSDLTYEPGTDYVVGMHPDTSTNPFKVDLIVDDTSTTLTSGYGPDNATKQNFWLFAKHQGGTLTANTYAKCRFYNFRVWDDKDKGTLNVDMVPVYHFSTGKVRLYDRVRESYKDPSSDFAFPWAGVVTNTAATAATLEVCVDEGESATNSCIRFEGDIDFVKSGEGEWTVGGDGLSIAGSFKPVAGTVSGITLADGATLDLSGLSGPYSLDGNGLAFADGATISLAIGSRKPTSTTPFITWTAAPSNLAGLAFVRGADEPQKFGVTIGADGIYLAIKGLVIVFY